MIESFRNVFFYQNIPTEIEIGIFSVQLFQPTEDASIHEVVFVSFMHFIQCTSKEESTKRNVLLKVYSQKMFCIIFNILIVLTSEIIDF